MLKTKYVFEIMDLEDGLVAVPVGDAAERFSGVLKVNDTAAAILKLLERDTTENRIVDMILREYEGDKMQIAEFVHEFVEQLRVEGIME